jgi:hypothetical protein
MQIKWMAFFIFVWFFGMILGSALEEQSLQTYSRYTIVYDTGTENATVKTTFGYLFDFSKSETETAGGSVFWKLASPDYYFTWLGIMTLDFTFLKDTKIDPDTGSIELNTDGSIRYYETIQSYFFKALGIIGILCFILMFMDVIQGLIPGL